jgi:hypothetical protein
MADMPPIVVVAP